jgi:hypothetical protein
MAKHSCSQEYYENCKNQLIKCKSCLAGTGSRSLYYEPLEKDIGLDQHPYSKDNKRQKIQRRARHTEKSIERDIAKGTVRSGAANGDGDIHLLKGELRVEVKDRGERKSWNLTWDEYSKGLKQGIDIYAINVECPDNKKRRMYIMEEQLFMEWLALARQQYIEQLTEFNRTNK